MNNTPSPPNPSSPSQYWCNHCSNFVSIESILGSIICHRCRHRLPPFISAASLPPPPPLQTHLTHFPNIDLDVDFFRIYHLMEEEESRRNDTPPPPSPPSPPPPPSPPSDYDYLRLDLTSWDDINVLDNTHMSRSNQENNQENGQRRRNSFMIRPLIENHSRRRRRAALGHDELGRGGIRRHRVVWGEYFSGEGGDRYFGNPGDYVDEDGYEDFLRSLAEGDSGGNRGAPPAGEAAVMGLETVGVSGEEAEGEGGMVCVVCRDLVSVGEFVKKLPCRHGYHGECIVEWLKVRNSCPVCRFELPTDDPEYEVERMKKLKGRMDGGVDGSTSNASDGDGDGSGSGAVGSSYDVIE